MNLSKRINSWLHAPLGWLLAGIARLPWGILYLIADVIYLLAYHVVRYRRRVVTDNLAKCFPEYDRTARDDIRCKFYRHFADYIVETIKLAHVSDNEMRERVEYRDIEIVDRLLASGHSIVAYFSHCFNWEWAPSITLWTTMRPDVDAEFSQVYRPLKNEWLDSWFLRLRGRFGSHSFAKRSVLRDLIMLRRRGIPSMTGFMSDQKPSHGDPTLPLLFLGRPTAMITGTETLARKLGYAVVYMDIERLGRGHYRVTIRPICDNPADLAPMEITRRYAKLLENTIRRCPSDWLWTHKRWKIPVEFPENE